MWEIIVLSLIAAAGILFLVFKFGKMKRILAFDVFIDIVATTILCFTMAGTFTGIMIALTAGMIISIVLFAMKKAIGSDTLTSRGWVDEPGPNYSKIREYWTPSDQTWRS